MAKGKNPQVSWAQATRDITVAAINKGQLPVLGAIAVVLLVIWKLPEQDVSHLAKDMVESLKNRMLLGYFMFVLTLIAWLIHARVSRKQYSAEYERIGLEKSALQSSAAGVKFKTSD